MFSIVIEIFESVALTDAASNVGLPSFFVSFEIDFAAASITISPTNTVT